MNPHFDTERALEAWLEEGPSRLPDRVVDATIASLDDIEQRRSWWPPGRVFMQRMMIPAAAAAALLVGIFAVASIGGSDGSPGVGGDADGGNRYVSERHGYAVDLPDETWEVRELEGVWPVGFTFRDDAPGADRLEHIGELEPTILINSQPVPGDMSFDEWAADFDAAGERAFPLCDEEAVEDGSIDGVPARIVTYLCEDSYRGVEATLFHGGRAYAFRVFGTVKTPEFDPANPRPVFDEWLARIEFTD